MSSARDPRSGSILDRTRVIERRGGPATHAGRQREPPGGWPAASPGSRGPRRGSGPGSPPLRQLLGGPAPDEGDVDAVDLGPVELVHGDEVALEGRLDDVRRQAVARDDE